MIDLLRFQMEEKKLLELQAKLKDQDYIHSVQQKDKTAEDTDKKNFIKLRLQKEEYLKALKEQIKQQNRYKQQDNASFEQEGRLKKKRRK